MTSRQPPGKALFERLLAEEREDDIICSFGYDFFNGIRWAAGCGSVLSFVASYRLFGDLKHLVSAADARNPHSYDRTKLTIIKGMRVHPYMTAGTVSFFLMGCTKLFKWYSASVRVNNFHLAEFDFMLARQSFSEDPQAQKLFDEYCTELAKPESNLFRDSSNVRGRRAPRTPSFSDGVAVGLFGSLFDSWLPTGPTSAYIGFSAGRKLLF
jgi:hypothetical protein